MNIQSRSSKLSYSRNRPAVVENHRPFDGEHRVRAAYYLAVPFLFDARKQSQPAGR